MNNRLIAIFVLVLAAVSAAFAQKVEYAPKDVPNVQLENEHRYLSDVVGIISPDATAHIDSVLENLRKTAGVQAAAVFIPKMPDGMDIDTYATELFTLWGLGSKGNDNGLLVLVSYWDRKYAIRTGYGLEEFLPDVICGRIERDIMVPAFKADQYSEGFRKAIDKISEVLSDPSVRQQFLDDIEKEEREGWEDVLALYAGFCAVAACLFFLLLLCKLVVVKGQTPYKKYLEMRTLSKVSGACAWFTFGLTLLTYIPLRIMMHRWRNGTHLCQNCGTKMEKLDEDSDNDYLTPAQDAEERIKSVDYDVWLCPTCGGTDIYRFDEDRAYSECPYCHARTCRFARDTVLRRPTQYQEGAGVKTYECLNCKKVYSIAYKIAKLATPPVIIGTGGFGRGGGGGISGGGWGGGSTGGGGASGGW